MALELRAIHEAVGELKEHARSKPPLDEPLKALEAQIASQTTTLRDTIQRDRDATRESTRDLVREELRGLRAKTSDLRSAVDGEVGDARGGVATGFEALSKRLDAFVDEVRREMRKGGALGTPPTPVRFSEDSPEIRDLKRRVEAAETASKATVDALQARVRDLADEARRNEATRWSARDAQTTATLADLQRRLEEMQSRREAPAPPPVFLGADDLERRVSSRVERSVRASLEEARTEARTSLDSARREQDERHREMEARHRLLEQSISAHSASLKDEMGRLRESTAREKASDEVRALSEKVAELGRGDGAAAGTTDAVRALGDQLKEHTASLKDELKSLTGWRDQHTKEALEKLDARLSELSRDVRAGKG